MYYSLYVRGGRMLNYKDFTTEELKKELKALRFQYHQPHNRRMNGKPTAEAYDLYGKRIYEIQAILMERNQNKIERGRE